MERGSGTHWRLSLVQYIIDNSSQKNPILALDAKFGAVKYTSWRAFMILR
jgi:hypothetical protein